MPLQWWSEPRTKEKRQAEFLVHEHCPWSAIERIGVCDESGRAAVLRILAQSPHRPPVEVRADWYY